MDASNDQLIAPRNARSRAEMILLTRLSTPLSARRYRLTSPFVKSACSMSRDTTVYLFSPES